MLLSKALEFYLVESSAAQKSPATIQRINYFGQSMIAFLGDIDVDTLTPMLVNSYISHHSQRGLSPHTAWGYFKHAKSLLRSAYRNEIMDRDISARLIAPRVGDANKPILTDEQIKKLWQSLQGDKSPIGRRNMVIVATLLRTGLRSFELCALTLDDYHDDPPYLMVRRGKGKKSRPVPITPALRKYLWRWVNDWRKGLFVDCQGYAKTPSNFLFPNIDGQELGAQGLQKMLRKELREVGVNEGSAHIFRHTMATLNARSGVDIERLRQILGHSNLSVTQDYIHLLPVDLFGNRPNPLDRLGL